MHWVRGITVQQNLGVVKGHAHYLATLFNGGVCDVIEKVGEEFQYCICDDTGFEGARMRGSSLSHPLSSSILSPKHITAYRQHLRERK